MKPEEFNWRAGNVVHWTLDFDEGAPPSALIDELTEDLAQVQFGASVILDVGWYPEGAPDGAFKVFVIVNMNWETPVWVAESKSFDELRVSIRDAIEVALQHSTTSSA